MFWRRVSVLAVSWLIACGGEDAKPFDGVLHAQDADVTEDAAITPLDSGLPDVGLGVDAGVDASEGEDAAIDAGVDAGEMSPLLGLESGNTPNAVVDYGGNEASPGLTFVATHLALDPIGEALSVDFYARVRNDFLDDLCYFSLDVRFLDSNGIEILSLDTLADLPPHNTSIGLGDCVSAGDEFYIHGTDFLSYGASTITLDRVAVIEWVYGLGGSLYNNTRSTLGSVTDLDVNVGSFDQFVLSGRVTNNSSTTIGYPSVAAYVLNRGGQPLTRLFAITTSPIVGFSSWSFETGGYDYEFSPLDVDHVLSYQEP